jgi:hypothetical protein
MSLNTDGPAALSIGPGKPNAVPVQIGPALLALVIVRLPERGWRGAAGLPLAVPRSYRTRSGDDVGTSFLFQNARAAKCHFRIVIVFSLGLEDVSSKGSWGVCAPGSCSAGSSFY